MTVQILAPVLVQIALTFALMIATGVSRTRAVSEGDARIGDIALGQSVWPEQPTKFANAFNNQFQLPVLFYVVVVILLVTRQASVIDVGLAWAFAASRIVHALIHVTTNNVMHRFYAFVIGAGILMTIWGHLALRLAIAGSI